MIKKLLILVLLCSAFNVYAQSKKHTFYFKNNELTNDKDNFDFERIILEPDASTTLFRLYEFYADGTEKTRGYITSYKPDLMYEGILKHFNEQSLLIEKLFYKNGILNGEADYYYDDGKPKIQIMYNEMVNLSNGLQLVHIRITNAYDTLGNQTVVNGNGTFKEKIEDHYEEGNYLNGYKDGVWKGTIHNQNFEENYKEGKIVSGIAYLADGTKTEYHSPYQDPIYPGGMSEFYQYIRKNYKTPHLASIHLVKGQLKISFKIDTDGTLTEYEFKNDLGYGTQKEAIRLLNDCPLWVPAKTHGIPIQVKYNIAINLDHW